MLQKQKLFFFKTSNKNYDADLKIKLCRKKIHASPCVKYLGVSINENLNWKIHINEISAKLIKGTSVNQYLRHNLDYKKIQIIRRIQAFFSSSNVSTDTTVFVKD